MGGEIPSQPPPSLPQQLETLLRGRGQSRLGRTRPRGPLFPQPPPSSQPWMRLMELTQLQQCRGEGGNNSWTEGGPSPRLGRVQPKLEREERDGPPPGAERGPSAPSHREPSPTIQVGSCPQVPQEQSCSVVGSHTWGPGSGGPRCPSRAPYKPTARPTRIGHEAPPPLATPQATVLQEDAWVQHAGGRHNDPGRGGLV